MLEYLKHKGAPRINGTVVGIRHGSHFPKVVLRGAASLNQSLKAYYGQLPRNMHHYGGWYTMTTENWPLIGPMGVEGAFMNCALSGFGTMSACAAGELCAAWVTESELPFYASDFSLYRLNDAAEYPG